MHKTAYNEKKLSSYNYLGLGNIVHSDKTIKSSFDNEKITKRFLCFSIKTFSHSIKHIFSYRIEW